MFPYHPGCFQKCYYEKALMSAIQQSFPESQLSCWFYFTQSIVRYCHRKMNSVLDLVRTNPILALTHLPATRNDPRCPQFSMADGFSAIMHYTRQFPAIEQGMRNFLIGYVEYFWLLQVGPDLISVFGEEYRTNNYLESFHTTLLTQMQRHPNIWNFLQKLTVIENQFFVEFDQARRNLRRWSIEKGTREHYHRLNRSCATTEQRWGPHWIFEKGWTPQ